MGQCERWQKVTLKHCAQEKKVYFSTMDRDTNAQLHLNIAAVFTDISHLAC